MEKHLEPLTLNLRPLRLIFWLFLFIIYFSNIFYFGNVYTNLLLIDEDLFACMILRIAGLSVFDNLF